MPLQLSGVCLKKGLAENMRKESLAVCNSEGSLACVSQPLMVSGNSRESSLRVCHRVRAEQRRLCPRGYDWKTGSPEVLLWQISTAQESPVGRASLCTPGAVLLAFLQARGSRLNVTSHRFGLIVRGPRSSAAQVPQRRCCCFCSTR